MINHSLRLSFYSSARVLWAAAVSIFAVREPRTAPFYSRVEQLAARQSHKLKVAGSSPAPAPSLRAGRGFPSSRSRLSGVLFSLDVPQTVARCGLPGFFLGLWQSLSFS
jgi:hypothetical protein